MARDRSKKPANRDGYELGYIAGLWGAADWLDERIREMIQKQQDNEDDE